MTKRTKLLLGGGIASIALLGVGAWAWRRRSRVEKRAPRELEVGDDEDVGDDDASSLAGPEDMLDFVTRAPKKAMKAEAEIALALAGNWLDDYRRASANKTFWNAPTTTVEAYYTAAYWTAVGARLVHSRRMATWAAQLGLKGETLYKLPGSSLLVDGIPEILQSAVETLEPHAENRNIKAILAALRQEASPGAIENMRQVRRDREPVQRSLEKGARDVGRKLKSAVSDECSSTSGWTTALQAASGTFTGRKPECMGSLDWFFTKWALRVGTGALLVFGVKTALGGPLFGALRGRVATMVRGGDGGG